LRRAVCSLVYRLHARSLQLVKVRPHGGMRFGGVTLPLQHLADHPQRLSSSIRPRRVPGKLLVCEDGVVLDWTGGFYDVDMTRSVTHGKLGV
jgi:hypothetical protein